LATALNALGAINPALGVKLRLKITTITTNTTAITSFYLITTTTAVAQANYYPLETVGITISAKDAATSVPIQDARVYLVAAAGGFLPEGTVILNTLTNASGVVTTSIELSGPSQPVTGRVRKMTDSPRYRNAPLSGTITSAGLDITSFLVSDE
jgi:hypothetical protein